MTSDIDPPIGMTPQGMPPQGMSPHGMTAHPTTHPSLAPLEAFLQRQSAADLAAVLLELASDHEAVAERLERMQLADQPRALVASFTAELEALKDEAQPRRGTRSTDFASALERWVAQVAHLLLPRHPEAARTLFEAFINADVVWFEHHADDDFEVGEAMHAACAHWLQAAAQSEPPPGGWASALMALHEADGYSTRDDLLRRAGLLLDETAQRALVARLEMQLARMLAQAPPSRPESPTAFQLIHALSLLAESLGDPEIEKRARLRLRTNGDR